MVNHIIISQIELQKKDKRADLFKEFGKLVPSRTLMERLSTNINKGIRLYTSDLAITEILFALREEYRCRKMSRDGVPHSKWPSLNKYFPLKKEDVVEIKGELESFVKYFCKSKEFPKESRIKICRECHDLEILFELTHLKGIRSHDAVLLCTALKNNCDYFCTCDRTLRDYKKIRNLKICSPESLIPLFRTPTQNSKKSS